MQTRYLLDTCTLVAMLKDEYGIRNKIREVGAEQCFVSEASVAELFYGAYNSANPLRHLQEVSFVISHFVVIPTSVALELWGKNKAFLRKKGLLIDDFDILIGSTAIAEKMTLVTDNVKHLSRLPDVEIENWLSR